MQLKFKKLTENAVTPKLAHEHDACVDLYITSIEYLGKDGVVIDLDKMTEDEKTDAFNMDIFNVNVHTGIAVEIPVGYVGLLFPRSSVYKKSYFLRNSVGVIDSNYRGEITAKFGLYDLYNGEPFDVKERGVQLMVIKHEELEMIEVEELSETERGENGHGSSGRF